MDSPKNVRSVSSPRRHEFWKSTCKGSKLTIHLNLETTTEAPELRKLVTAVMTFDKHPTYEITLWRWDGNIFSREHHDQRKAIRIVTDWFDTYKSTATLEFEQHQEIDMGELFKDNNSDKSDKSDESDKSDNVISPKTQRRLSLPLKGLKGLSSRSCESSPRDGTPRSSRRNSSRSSSRSNTSSKSSSTDPSPRSPLSLSSNENPLFSPRKSWSPRPRSATTSPRTLNFDDSSPECSPRSPHSVSTKNRDASPRSTTGVSRRKSASTSKPGTPSPRTPKTLRNQLLDEIVQRKSKESGQ